MLEEKGKNEEGEEEKEKEEGWIDHYQRHRD